MNTSYKKHLTHRIYFFRNFAYDNQIRNDLAELYQIMYGLNRPNCVPLLNEVIIKTKNTFLQIFRIDE